MEPVSDARSVMGSNHIFGQVLDPDLPFASNMDPSASKGTDQVPSSSFVLVLPSSTPSSGPVFLKLDKVHKHIGGVPVMSSDIRGRLRSPMPK
jgi:hypothetical protein